MGLLGPSIIQKPNRIVSLVPSLTETIEYICGSNVLVGRTRFCIHPSNLKHVQKIGGTKNPNIDRIRRLNPDLIIANKEENRKEDIQKLSAHFPVWVSEISGYKSMISEMEAMGEIMNVKENAQKLIDEIEKIKSTLVIENEYSVAYLIWKEPWMTIGADTFIHDSLAQCGLRNIYSDLRRYPEVSLSELKERNPDFVLLSSEPFPFKEKHIAEISVYLPSNRIILVDGEMFSWYGSRYVKAIDYFKDLKRSMSTQL